MSRNQSKPRQRLLALDTSTASLAAAVLEDQELLGEIHESVERNHSVHMHPVLERVLQQSGVTVADLDGIAVGVGPGSYTGVRMAVTAAKTLAWANDIPIVGISSLHALAWGGLEQALKRHDEAGAGRHWVIPVMDARRGQAYTALFEGSTGAAPERLAPDAIRLMQSWVEELSERLVTLEKDSLPAGIWFTGDTGVHADAASRLAEVYGGPVTVLPYELEGQWAGLLGAARLLRGERDEPHTLVPNYTQLSEAESNLLRKR
ncbi:tRNA (adenosine(37)-N6)-threonylcarbamoyltransferase complex dimerization subunit type 1 TsaB [Paenibacillus sp. F411]|uniref:tRNA (adenosine(37)-N6)-threonylcarbamoyltransferase complex dimerization subunit type 1 TsaB n=1 Tax=Paenibacillus sp. F411 TaxID=2820239 RepID=UPI001AAF7644|nr:tRNA (adenosine(37)-N6)-threonylcarbamoyltransferase complex dimerization subunit type 1 TsaB [Paenibacillus sp. F411]MBO2943769.1 tRNA (adenosine(37)-N6)-threonylcarbamoyltransferase complex dimerization subunit type 1 TsaB [Paenibacillus sp. F411]